MDTAAETTITFTKTRDKGATPQSLNMIAAITSSTEAHLHRLSLTLPPRIRLTSITDHTMNSLNLGEATKGLNLGNIIMTVWQGIVT